MGIPIEIFLLVAAILTLISVFASKLSDKFAVPALLFFLVIGMAAGSEGVGGIYFDNYSIAKTIGIIALIFIIFMGGVGTLWRSIRPVMIPGIILSTAGVFMTALVVGIFAVLILKFSLAEGLLLGAIVSSTDAAAVFSVLRSKRISLKGGLKPLLEFESGSNDPMAVFLTITMINIVSLNGSNGTAFAVISSFVSNMGIGALFGYLMSRFAVTVINKVKLEFEGLYPVLTISLVLLTYTIATLFKGNGFLAVYLLGLFMSRSDFVNKKTLIRFHEGIAWLMQIVMFLTLGLLVSPSKILSVMASALLIAAILIFLARPLSVFLCLLPFRFNIPEKLMVSWVGLRGAVPVILATFPLLAGVPQSQIIFNIVFFIVLTSVLIQGISIPSVARFLKVNAPFDNRKKFPIELNNVEEMDASLEDMIVPYNSMVVGRSIAELHIPTKALIVLIARSGRFIVPSGSTVIEEGDVLLVLVNGEDMQIIQKMLSTLK